MNRGIYIMSAKIQKIQVHKYTNHGLKHDKSVPIINDYLISCISATKFYYNKFRPPI